ncbi:MAG: hypothetical protein Q4B13_05925 [Lautropia sp.]|nr:hypothetical protein [Lautropia sp.]
MKTMSFNGRTMREAIALAKAKFGSDIEILDSGMSGDEVQVTVIVPLARSERKRRAIAKVSACITARNDVSSREKSGDGGSRVVNPDIDPVQVVSERGKEPHKSSVPEEVSEALRSFEKSALDSNVSRNSRSVIGKADKNRIVHHKNAPGAETTRKDKRRAVRARSSGHVAASTSETEKISQQEASSISLTTHGPEKVVKDAAEAGVNVVKPAVVTSTSLEAANDDLVTVSTEHVQTGKAEPVCHGDSQTGSTLEFQRLRQERMASVLTEAAPRSEHSADLGGVAKTGKASRTGEAIKLETDEKQASATIDLRSYRSGSEVPQESLCTHVDSSTSILSSGTAITYDGAISRIVNVLHTAKKKLGLGRRRRIWDVTQNVSLEAVSGSVNPTLSGRVSIQEGRIDGFVRAEPLPLASILDSRQQLSWPDLSADLHADTAAALPAERMSGIGWFEEMRRRPAQMRLIRNLLKNGFSPLLSRTLVELLPAEFGEVQSDEWLRQMLIRALSSISLDSGMDAGASETVFDKGGIYALVGPTGVGKTTSIAKIAAHHVLKYGPRSLALITADIYRIGAQEQLRAFGRMLGVPVHVAQDRNVLDKLLQEHESCRLVLIDTAGVSQRDQRVGQLTTSLELAQVQRVLVMNAAAQSSSYEEVIESFGKSRTSGVLISKTDEAIGLGACIDALIRHRLPILGYTDGQRVPEDYHPASLLRLADLALDASVVSQFPAWQMTDSELRNMFEGPNV